MSAEPTPSNSPASTPNNASEEVTNSTASNSSETTSSESSASTSSAVSGSSQSLSYYTDKLRRTTEDLVAFGGWVVELIRTRNWPVLLALAEAILILFCWPGGVLSKALKPFFDLLPWYPSLFWFAVVAIPITAVAVALRTMPHHLPGQQTPETVTEHRAIKGLRPFTQDDAEIFRRLQRQQDLKDCCETLESSSFRFGKLVGKSGCGKTSFLQAGLIPVLQQRGQRVVYVRFSNQDPLEAVREAIIKQLQLSSAPPVVSEPAGFIGLLKHVMQQSDTPLILLFDQFEQFFVQNKSDAERQPFLEALEIWYARADLQKIAILFSTRADLSYHLFEIEKRLGYSPSPLEVVLLRCFRPKEAAEVLFVIAETEDLAFDRPFVEKMMAEELGNREDGSISPVDLQILASMLNRESVAELRGFNEQTFQKLGGIDGLLRHYLEDVIDSSTTPRQRKILIEVLLKLTDIERQVRAEVLTIRQLQEKLKDEATPREVYEATMWLARADVRLISRVEREASPGYELAHERMIPALLQLSGKQLTEANKANRLLDKRVNEWLGSSYHSRYLFNIRELILLRRQRAYLIWGAKERPKRKLIRKSWKQLYFVTFIFVVVGLFVLGMWSGLEYTKTGQLWQMRRNIVRFSQGSVSKTAIAAEVLAANGHFRSALKRVKEIDFDSSNSKAHALKAISQATAKLEEGGRAEEILERVFSAAETIDNSTSKASVLKAIAQAYVKLEERESAGELLRKAVSAAETIDSANFKAYLFQAIAQVYAKLQERERAGELFGKAVSAAEAIDSSHSKANALSRIARATGELEEREIAVQLLQRVFSVAETIDNSNFKAKTLSAIAQVTGELEERERAVQLLQRAFSAAETIDNSNSKAYLFQAIAQAYAQLERREEAAESLGKAFSAAEAIGKSTLKAYALNAIAQVYAQLERREKAEELLGKAFSIAETIGRSTSKTYLFQAIAQTHTQLGQQERAGELLEKALSAAEAIDFSDSKANAFSAIAQATGELEEREIAGQLLKKAFSAAEKIDSSYSKVYALKAIAQATEELEEREIAGQRLENARSAAESINSSHSKAKALSAIAQMYAELGQSETAGKLLEKASSAAESIDSSHFKANALSAIAQAYAELEQWKLALKTTRKCRGNEDCRVRSLEAVLKVHAEKQSS